MEERKKEERIMPSLVATTALRSHPFTISFYPDETLNKQDFTEIRVWSYKITGQREPLLGCKTPQAIQYFII